MFILSDVTFLWNAPNSGAYCSTYRTRMEFLDPANMTHPNVKLWIGATRQPSRLCIMTAAVSSLLQMSGRKHVKFISHSPAHRCITPEPV